MPGEVVNIAGVQLIGTGNWSSDVARDASQMYASNLFNLVEDNWDEEQKLFKVDFEDDILPGCIITHGGEVVHDTIKNLMAGGQ